MPRLECNHQERNVTRDCFRKGLLSGRGREGTVLVALHWSIQTYCELSVLEPGLQELLIGRGYSNEMRI